MYVERMVILAMRLTGQHSMGFGKRIWATDLSSDEESGREVMYLPIFFIFGGLFKL